MFILKLLDYLDMSVSFMQIGSKGIKKALH